MKIWALVSLAFLIQTGLGVSSSDPFMYSPQTQFPCSGYDAPTGSFFSFNKMMTIEDYHAPIYLNNFNGEAYQGEAIFNICSNLAVDPDCKSQSDIGSVGYLKVTGVSSKQAICIGMNNLLKNDRDGYTKWNIKAFIGQQGEPFTWTITSQNSNSTVPFNTQFVLVCGKAEGFNDMKVSVDSKFRTIVIRGSSASACPVSAGRVTTFLKNSKAIAAFLIVLGTLLMLSGFIAFKYVSAVVGFALAFLFALMCAIGMQNPYTWNILTYIVVICISLGAGVLIGLFGYFFTDFCMIIAGGVVGYFGGMSIIGALSPSLGYGSDAAAAEIIILVICVVGGILCGLYLHDHLLILITSFGGAFLVTIGVTALVTKFPELSSFDQYMRLDPLVRDQLSKEFVIFCGLFILLGTVGAVIQYKTRNGKIMGTPEAANAQNQSAD